MLERVDVTLSNWILAWYILYELKLISYNPKGALLFGLIGNLIAIGVMVYYSYDNILVFCIVNFFIKVVPLWRVYNVPYGMKDVYATLVLFAVYSAWMYVNGLSFVKVVRAQLQNIRENKPVGPFSYLLTRMNII